MSPPLNDDADTRLRAVFAQQRACDRAEAPAWRGEWLRAPITAHAGSTRTVSCRAAAWARWVPAGLAVACVAAAAVVGLGVYSSPKSQPRLSEVLPPLFEEADFASGAAPELFASLGPASFMDVGSPSDLFLPDSLSPSPTSSSLNLP